MGPLHGTRIVEFAGIGPAPFGCMALADLGAEIIRIDRAGGQWGDPDTPPADLLNRGRRSVALNLKDPAGVEAALDLVATADVVVEGLRPGVMERLGLGPDECLARNPKVIYARMTGWGQEGPYAPTAGHDINYISLAGALAHMGRAGEKPTFPINLVGDFGGGGMLLALGVCAALVETAKSGEGQVLDVAMVDGAALLMTMIHSFQAMGIWTDDRGSNMLDSGAHFYDTFECADGGYVSIGAIEPQFYAELIRLTGLEGEELPWQHDKTAWPDLKERLAGIFKTKSRDEWCAVMEGTDVCFAPVLTMSEAPQHPHNVQRQTFVEVAGITQPAPAPVFSRTPGEIRRPPPHAGQHSAEVLAEIGYDDAKVQSLRDAGTVT